MLLRLFSRPFTDIMKTLVICCTLFAVSSLALAQAYFGGAPQAGQGGLSYRSTLDYGSRGTGVKVRAGYRFTQRFATEMVSVDVDQDAQLLPGAGRGGVGLGIVGLLPVTPNWSGFAHAGVGRSVDNAVSIPGGELPSYASVGMGVSYALNNHLLLHGAVGRYRLNAADDYHDGTSLSMGVRYRF